MITTDKFL